MLIEIDSSWNETSQIVILMRTPLLSKSGLCMHSYAYGESPQKMHMGTPCMHNDFVPTWEVTQTPCNISLLETKMFT